MHQLRPEKLRDNAEVNKDLGHHMGWLWIVGSIKLQVSFAKEPYKRTNILQKVTHNFIDPTIRSHPIALHHTAIHCRCC